MTESMRIEMPILANCMLLFKYKTIGDLIKAFKLKFVKYIFLDPADDKFKGRTPYADLPLVAGASITVVGNIEEIVRFSEEATKL